MRMTPQEIFDKAYLGLKAQGCQSQSVEGNMCLYHGPDGSHCGVGFLVSPDVAAAWDKRGVTEIETLLDTDANEDEPHVVGIEPWMHANRKLLAKIQEAHDSAKFWHRKNDGLRGKFRQCRQALQPHHPTGISMTAPQEEWGPWIEWHGGNCPVSPHDWVHLIFDDEDEFIGTNEIGGMSACGFTVDAGDDAGWTWTEAYELGLGGDARIVRFRIKRPRALLDMIQLIADLPAPVAPIKTDGVIA